MHLICVKCLRKTLSPGTGFGARFAPNISAGASKPTVRATGIWAGKDAAVSL